MSGTPGTVSLRVVWTRLLCTPSRATRAWNGRNVEKKALDSSGWSADSMKFDTALSYARSGIDHVETTFASRIALVIAALIRSVYAAKASLSNCLPLQVNATGQLATSSW